MSLPSLPLTFSTYAPVESAIWIAADLVRNRLWFESKPMPDGMVRFTVKVEETERLREAVEAAT